MLLKTGFISIAAKELKLVFASPAAYLFLFLYTAVTLFVFFWGEAFFARNIADVRPMFEWMPVLLIFFAAAISMRMWSEERRSGTLEHLLTQPVSPWHFVIGKFLACVALLVIALAISLLLPVTVSLFANLDWGPVLSAYVATLLLGAAYISIGLFVSSRTENQIVALMVTALLCGVFYLLGSPVLTDLFGHAGGDLLRKLGTGSRFESITRGVIDLRDLYYYLSIVFAFLFLNRYTLEQVRWAHDGDRHHHRTWRTLTALAIANALIANLWLAPLTALRVDVTRGELYSISDATRGYLAQLQEPLVITGYFSEQTHPLLAPLVPQLRDLMAEYEAEGKGRVRTEFIDPLEDPKAEEEASRTYGINPVPFQVADRHQSAVVNSYFNLVIHYGDEYTVLGFNDLIDVKSGSGGGLEVLLRNPEYDITNAVKQVLYAYRSGGDLVEALDDNLSLTAYVSADDRLPESLKAYRPVLESVAGAMREQSGGRLRFEIIDPDANGGEVAAAIQEQYGLTPMLSSIFDTNPFYFYQILSNGDVAVQIPLPDELDEAGLTRGLEAGLKRFSAGFTKQIGLVTPPPLSFQAQQMGAPPGDSFRILGDLINENMTTNSLELADGRIDEDVDLVLVAAPEGLDDVALFAVDQFLMQGGTVIVSTSPFKITATAESLQAQPLASGMEEWLEHHGVRIEQALVMDEQNSPFPVPVVQDLGGFSLRKLALVDYPFFVDVRESGLSQTNPVTAGLSRLTVAWPSPISVDSDRAKDREILELVKSSPGSWLNEDLVITPQLSDGAGTAFEVGEFEGSQTLALAMRGRFESYFAGQESPLLARLGDQQDESAPQDDGVTATEPGANDDSPEPPEEIITSVIQRSPESARLIVVSSNSFASDQVLQTLTSISGTQTLEPVQMLINSIDWSLEDSGLVGIRARGHFNRTLPPMAPEAVRVWEYLNYLLAAIAVAGIFLVRRWLVGRSLDRYRRLLSPGAQT